MNAEDKKRYSSLLAEISLAPGIGAQALRIDLERVHGVVATALRVRADLALLADAGLIRWNGEAAACTERGREVACLRAPLPDLG